MTAALVDTDILIDFLRGDGRASALLESLIGAEEPALASVITRAELVAGARPREREDLAALFAALGWVPVTDEVAEHAGDLSRTYGRRGSRATLPDYLIGATAQLLDARLLTRNVRHFPMFPELQPPYEL